MAAKRAKNQVDVSTHVLIPKHSKVSEKEKKELFEKFHIAVSDLPRMNLSDAALFGLDVKPGDVIKVERPSPTTKNTVFYRGVADA